MQICPILSVGFLDLRNVMDVMEGQGKYSECWVVLR